MKIFLKESSSWFLFANMPKLHYTSIKKIIWPKYNYMQGMIHTLSIGKKNILWLEKHPKLNEDFLM